MASTYAYSCVIGPTSGASAVTETVPNLSCLNILTSSPPQDEVITWTGGAGAPTSTIRYTNIMVVAQTSTQTGTVIAGRFDGDLVEKVVTTTALSGSGTPLLCPLGLGTIASASGVVVLTIVDPS